MAVPTSGELSMQKMAREAKHADYNGTQNMGKISMYDLLNGGDANGSTVSYPTLNTSCDPHPGTSLTNPLRRIVASNSCAPAAAGYNAQDIWIDGLASNGDTVYTSPCGTDTLAAGTYINCYNLLSENMLSGCDACEYITVNSSGVITASGCDEC